MREWLADILVDPATRRPLRLDVDAFVEPSGRRYPIVRGIPRFVETADAWQQQTSESFGFKWNQQQSYASEGQIAMSRAWLLERYGFESVDAAARYFESRSLVLDAGCGGGYSAGILLERAPATRYVGADISTAVDVAQSRLSHLNDAAFVQADLMALPFAESTFDTIFSEGVLHHTPSTEAAFRALVPLLKRGGEMLFYVYRRKGPVREFADDAIRAQIASLAPEEAWEALRPLTHLGRVLAEARATVTVPLDVPQLGISAGTYDVQRLVYGAFCKLFWNENFTFEENLHVNFDWYHPRYAHRSSEDDLTSWCDSMGMRISRMDVQESGITVRAVRD